MASQMETTTKTFLSKQEDCDKTHLKEKKTQVENLRTEIEEELFVLSENSKAMSDFFGKLETTIKEFDESFDAFHAVKEGDNYVVKRADINIYRECNSDHTYTEDEFEKLDQKVMDGFKNINHFANYLQWEGYRGVQFKLNGNAKLYKYLEDLAFKGNVYVADFLIFDTLQRMQYEDSSLREKAEQLYYLVHEPALLPQNKIYRALLFNEYDQLVQDYDSEKLFTCWYEWNMNPRILREQIRSRGIKFEEEANNVLLWFIQNSD